MSNEEGNRQVRKTRNALLVAFRDLVLSRKYSEIRVADIIELADVGRSTFYDHFRSKDDLLRESLGGILDGVADAILDDCDMTRLGFVMEHFRENQHKARALLSGPSSPQVVGVLEELLIERLETMKAKKTGVPLEFVASQIAGATFGVILEWLRRPDKCEPERIAKTIRDGALALRNALVGAG